MKTFSVAVANLFDNTLNQKLVCVEDNQTWKDALILAFELGIESYDDNTKYWLPTLSDNIEDASQEFFDCDMLLSVLEIGIFNNKLEEV